MILGHLSLQGRAAIPRRSSDFGQNSPRNVHRFTREKMIAAPRIDLTVSACHSYPDFSVAIFVPQYTKTFRLLVSAIPDLNGAGKVGAFRSDSSLSSLEHQIVRRIFLAIMQGENHEK